MLTLCIKNDDISKIKMALVLKCNFFKKDMYVYLRTKFQAFSIILTGSILGDHEGGGGGNFSAPPIQNEPLKTQPRLGLTFVKIEFFSP